MKWKLLLQGNEKIHLYSLEALKWKLIHDRMGNIKLLVLRPIVIDFIYKSILSWSDKQKNFQFIYFTWENMWYFDRYASQHKNTWNENNRRKYPNRFSLKTIIPQKHFPTMEIKKKKKKNYIHIANQSIWRPHFNCSPVNLKKIYDMRVYINWRRKRKTKRKIYISMTKIRYK